MTASNKTTHYDLSQWTPENKPSFLGDLNGDLQKIDTALYTANTTATNASSVANQASAEVTSLGAQVQTNTTVITNQGQAITTVTNLANANSQKLKDLSKYKETNLFITSLGTYLSAFSPVFTTNSAYYREVTIDGITFLSIYGYCTINYTGQPDRTTIGNIKELTIDKNLQTLVNSFGYTRTIYSIGKLGTNLSRGVNADVDFSYRSADNIFSNQTSLPTGETWKVDSLITLNFQALIVLGDRKAQ